MLEFIVTLACSNGAETFWPELEFALSIIGVSLLGFLFWKMR